jgi:hypothetical protein
MTLLTNDDIELRVKTLADAFLKSVKTKPGDEAIVTAGVSLIVNLLQNINEIAYCMDEENARRDRGQ